MALKWLRKNNKKILALVCIPIMVIFILPSLARYSHRGRRDQLFGYYRGPDGGKQEINTTTINVYYRNLQVLRELGIPLMAQAGVISQLNAVDRFPVMLCQGLLFGDNSYGRALRSVLYRQIQQGNLQLSDQVKSKLKDSVSNLVNASPTDAPLYFYLLAQEARRAGIQANKQQVDLLLKLREHYLTAGKLPGPDINGLLQRDGITLKELRFAVSEFLSVLRYAQMVTRPLVVSEPQIKHDLQKSIEINDVKGTFVRFSANLYLSKVAEPTAQEIEQQFELYKDKIAGKVSKDNVYGFGYMLPDRVQVEFLKIDMAQAVKYVTDKFNKLKLETQEEQIQEFWRNNKQLFAVPVKKKNGKNKQNEKQSYVNPPYAQVEDKARELLLQQRAKDKAEQMMAAVHNESQNVLQQAGVSLTDKDIASKAADYSKLARKYSVAGLSITYGKSKYMSYNDAWNYQDFGQVYKMRKNAPGEGLLSIIFDCVPLHKGPVSRLDSPPVNLYEDIASLMSMVGNRPTGVYMVRVIGADKQREAVSLSDDGSEGPASAVSGSKNNITDIAGKNKLKEQVIRDVKMLKAYKLANEDIDRFVSLTKKVGWSKALAAVNKKLKTDPNQPFNPVNENKIEQLRVQMQQMQKYAASNPQAGFLQRRISQLRDLLDKVVDFANSHANKMQFPVVMPMPDEFSYFVFKSLSVTPPTRQEYLKRRAVVAGDALAKQQFLLSIVHFDPVNIKKRMGYKPKVEPETASKNTGAKK